MYTLLYVLYKIYIIVLTFNVKTKLIDNSFFSSSIELLIN